jgi:hypothetical protein
MTESTFTAHCKRHGWLGPASESPVIKNGFIVYRSIQGPCDCKNEDIEIKRFFEPFPEARIIKFKWWENVSCKITC